jgi:hypothetical protein
MASRAGIIIFEGTQKINRNRTKKVARELQLLLSSIAVGNPSDMTIWGRRHGMA